MSVVLNSYYSWLYRSRMIEKMPKELKVQIDSEYSQHEIGYWHRERRYFEAHRSGYSGQKIEASDEAKAWLVRLLMERGVDGVDVGNLMYVE